MATLSGFINWGDIKGGSTDDKHKDWSEVTAFNHGLDQVASGSRSNEGGAFQSEVNHHPFLVTKRMDSASPKLYEALHNGTHLAKVIVELTRPTGKAPMVFMRYTMTNVALCFFAAFTASASLGRAETLPLSISVNSAISFQGPPFR